MPVIEKGSSVPDFALPDQHNREFRLSDLGGRKVLLSWHPLAFTRVCARQMQALERNLSAFAKLGALPVGLSVDPVPCKHAWAKAIGARKLRLLSDFWPHGGLARRLGVFREESGFSERANIIVDERGRVLWTRVYPIKELPDLREVLKAMA